MLAYKNKHQKLIEIYKEYGPERLSHIPASIPTQGLLLQMKPFEQ